MLVVIVEGVLTLKITTLFVRPMRAWCRWVQRYGSDHVGGGGGVLLDEPLDRSGRVAAEVVADR